MNACDITCELGLARGSIWTGFENGCQIWNPLSTRVWRVENVLVALRGHQALYSHCAPADAVQLDHPGLQGTKRAGMVLAHMDVLTEKPRKL